MGNVIGSNTKSSTEIVNDIVSEASMQTITSCVSSASQDQSLKLKSRTGNIIISGKMAQNSSVNVSCLASTQKSNQMMNDISRALLQAVESSNTVFKFGKDSTEALSKIKTGVRQSINMDSILSSSTASAQKQEIEAISYSGNIIYSGSMEQTASIIAQTVADSVLNSVIGNKIVTEIDSSATSETKGIASVIDAVGGVLGNLFLPMMMFIGVIILIIVGVIVKSLFGGGGSADEISYPATSMMPYTNYPSPPAMPPYSQSNV